MYKNIQMLRALAALMVVLLHAAPHYRDMNGKASWLMDVASWGYTGVDLFFVISGFVIAATTFSKERNFATCKTFLKRRFARIYLGYWPFLLLMLLVTWLVVPERLEMIDMLGSFFLFNTNINELLHPVSWTLSYELYFYILFALLFAINLKRATFFIITFFSIILCIAVWSLLNLDYQIPFLLSPFLLEFLSGVMLYYFKGILHKKWIIPFSIIMVVAACSGGVYSGKVEGAVRVFTFGVAAFFILAIAISLEYRKLYVAKNWLVALGDASYTLYLIHWPMILVFYASGLRNYIAGQSQWLIEAGFASFILLCLIVSHFFYKKVELPLYKKITH